VTFRPGSVFLSEAEAIVRQRYNLSNDRHPVMQAIREGAVEVFYDGSLLVNDGREIAHFILRCAPDTITIPMDAIDHHWPDPSAPGRADAAAPRGDTIPARKRGPKDVKRQAVIDQMQKLPLNELGDMKEEVMAATFGASRATCRAARNEVLSNSRQTPTGDK
jgi:hypothetical protein